MAEHNLVDISGLDAGIGERVSGNLHDHCFDIYLTLPKWDVAPAYNA